MKNLKRIIISGVLSLSYLIYAENLDDLESLTMEELMNIEFSSLSKNSQSISKTPASVFVLTNEDIRRSGATTVMDAFRCVPGVNVAKLDSSKWMISMRGFQSRYANKLLVLIDGRSIYNPSGMGVYWDDKDLILQDIERIEFIKGPGGSLWGTNAVNGVINIITKSSDDTQGGLISLRGGTEEKEGYLFRYGDKISDELFYKFYVKKSYKDSGYDDELDKNKGHDAWEVINGGFRLDYIPSLDDTFTFDFSGFQEKSNQIKKGKHLPKPFSTVYKNQGARIDGYNLRLNWDKTLSETDNFAFQFYYDTYRRNMSSLKKYETFDFDSQYSFKLTDAQQITVGAGYRNNDFKTRKNESMNGGTDSDKEISSWFIQDEIELMKDFMKLTLGLKADKNEMSGQEYQPSARLAIYPTDKTTLWGAISHAVRTPASIEYDGILTLVNPPVGLTTPRVYLETHGIDPETVDAYELGIKHQFNDNISVDLSTFVNDYKDIRSIQQAGASPLVYTATNNIEGKTYGAEFATNIILSDSWRLKGGSSYLYMDLHDKDNPGKIATGQSAEDIEEATSRYQGFLQSFYDITETLSFDTTFRYVGGIAYHNIPGYYTADIRIGWELAKNAELSFVGQNLFDPQHPEYEPGFFATKPTEIQRGFYIQLDYKF